MQISAIWKVNSSLPAREKVQDFWRIILSVPLGIQDRSHGYLVMKVYDYTKTNNYILHRKNIKLKGLAWLSPSIIGFSEEELHLSKNTCVTYYKTEMFDVTYSL